MKREAKLGMAKRTDGGLKIAVIGGGSSYTPEIVEGLISRYERFPVRELWLADIESGKSKLETVGGLAKRMVDRAGVPIDVRLTLDRRRAIEGADFVLTQIRVGQLEARKWDERIPLRHGVIGQETTGPGGMMKALRTIPVILDICRDMEELAPEAWLLNFTNPAGMVTEAVTRFSGVKGVGLCNAPIHLLKWLSRKYGVPAERVYVEFVGLNHLHWATRIVIDGEDKLAEVLEQGEAYAGKNVPEMMWDPEFLRGMGGLPSYYLKYYYLTDAMLADQMASLQSHGTRAEEVQRVEEELFELYRNPALREKPKQLERRGGAYYSEAAVNLMDALHNDKRDIQTLNVPNGRTLDFLPPDAVIEVNCVVTGPGPIPLPVSVVPEQAKGLIAAVKSYERLTIEAALTGDRSIALQAMASHPLVPSVSTAKALLNEMLEQNREYLPAFFR